MVLDSGERGSGEGLTAKFTEIFLGSISMQSYWKKQIVIRDHTEIYFKGNFKTQPKLEEKVYSFTYLLQILSYKYCCPVSWVIQFRHGIKTFVFLLLPTPIAQWMTLLACVCHRLVYKLLPLSFKVNQIVKQCDPEGKSTWCFCRRPVSSFPHPQDDSQNFLNLLVWEPMTLLISVDTGHAYI